MYKHFSGSDTSDKIYFLNNRYRRVDTDNLKRQSKINICSDPASVLLSRQGHRPPAEATTPGLAHHSAGAQHPALSSELKFANFKEKSANRVSPVFSQSAAYCPGHIQKSPFLNEECLANAEAEQEAEVTISSQHAGWSMPSPPCNSPWLEGTHPELVSAFPSSGVFPNSHLLLGSHLAASQWLFLSSPSWEFFIFFFFANCPGVTQSQLDTVSHLLCGRSKRLSITATLTQPRCNSSSH